jgi:hypothetical protein
MINGSEVIDPCPISVAADMMVIVPSGVIDTHGLSALPARSVASAAATAEPLFPNATAKDSPATPTITWRRDMETLALRTLMCFVMAQASRAARSTARTMR